jgi:hypothetical protein
VKRLKPIRPWPIIFSAASALLVTMSAENAGAQTAPDKKDLLNKTNALLSRIPAQHQALLSSGMQRIQELARVLNESHSKMGDTGTVSVAPKVASPASTPSAGNAPIGPITVPGPGGTIQVSDPRLDFVNSAMAGFTQSETSTAWCGDTVVVGYNDSGAFARTAGVNFNSAWSFSSASYSSDRGRTFTAISYLNPGTNPFNFIAGDPVVVCTSPTQFYYSSIFASGQDSNGNLFNGVAVNSSTDGGQTWSDPVAAVQKDFTHSIDKPWLAADPTNASRLYATYTDFDLSGLFTNPPTPPRCVNDIRYAIELVSSADGGRTWGAPVIVHEECFVAGGFNSVQGSNPAVAQDGTVYVGYEFFPGLVPNNEIHLARSVDHGRTFAAPVKVSNVWPNGNFGLLQGGFRNNEFPQVAVDRSRGPSRGTVYLAWSDGSRNIVQDLPVIVGTYAYPDVMVAKSTDGGRTFTTPTAVSPVSHNFTGRGRDQFFPGIAVDRHGTVGVCYYDRRQDPTNSVIDRYCSVSENGGSNWQEDRVSEASWTPAHAADVVVNPFYIGDYDALSSDFLLSHGGFFGAFEVQTNGNPDVVAARAQ